MGGALRDVHGKMKKMFEDIRMSIRSIGRSGLSLKVGHRLETYYQLESKGDQPNFIETYKTIASREKHRVDRLTLFLFDMHRGG